MNLDRSHFSMQGKQVSDFDNVEDFPTLDDLMKDQNVSSNESKTVHYRRDLDSLG